MSRNCESAVDPFFVSILCQLANGNLIMKVFRVGLNRIHLFKYYRIEGEYLVSNLNRKVYPCKSLETVNKLIRENREQIEWGTKIFEPASPKDWNVVGISSIEIN